MMRWMISAAAGLLTAIFFGSFSVFAAQCDSVRENTLRLHIVANSDSAGDQKLKLRVRDAILEACPGLFEKADSLETAKEAAQLSFPEIYRICRQTLHEEGSDDAVEVSIVSMSFPTTDYGSFLLPAGRYDALRIEIGEAKGKNWFCVMYPSLCLGGAVGEEAAAERYAESGVVLPSPRYEFRFWLLEFFQYLGEEISVLFS